MYMAYDLQDGLKFMWKVNAKWTYGLWVCVYGLWARGMCVCHACMCMQNVGCGLIMRGIMCWRELGILRPMEKWFVDQVLLCVIEV